jgi:hypothetical protein
LLQLLGLEVKEHVWSDLTNRQRITVITKGIPIASFFNKFEEEGWRMEVPPIEINYYRDCKAYYVTFIDIPDKAPTQPK